MSWDEGWWARYLRAFCSLGPDPRSGEVLPGVDRETRLHRRDRGDELVRDERRRAGGRTACAGRRPALECERLRHARRRVARRGRYAVPPQRGPASWHACERTRLRCRQLARPAGARCVDAAVVGHGAGGHEPGAPRRVGTAPGMGLRQAHAQRLARTARRSPGHRYLPRRRLAPRRLRLHDGEAVCRRTAV